jgi:hypothetical protein
VDEILTGEVFSEFFSFLLLIIISSLLRVYLLLLQECVIAVNKQQVIPSLIS